MQRHARIPTPTPTPTPTHPHPQTPPNTPIQHSNTPKCWDPRTCRAHADGHVLGDDGRHDGGGGCFGARVPRLLLACHWCLPLVRCCSCHVSAMSVCLVCVLQSCQCVATLSFVYVCACVRACVRACVSACVRGCLLVLVRACVRA